MKKNLKNSQATYHLIIVVIAALFFANNTLAQEHTADIAIETNTDINQLFQIVEKDYKANRTWWYSWLGVYSSATLIQGAIAVRTQDKALKQDMYLGAATTILGTGSQLITPYVRFNLDQLQSFDQLSDTEKTRIIDEAKDYLIQSAKYQKAIHSWNNHALCTAVNLASGAITWLAFDRTLKDGIINFAINTAITELQVWTLPLRAKKEAQKLLTYELNGIYKNSPQFYASATPFGMQLQIVF